MINLLKNCCIHFRNILLWLSPFLLFGLILYGVVFFLGSDLTKYIELLSILSWPITVLIGLSFFRKVVTYMFFSMDEFNFFGIKGDLKNVHQMISEEVDKKFIREKEEKERKEEVKKLEEKLNNSSATAGENLQLAKDFLNLYKDYKEEAQKKMQELNIEIKNLKERVIPENITPGIIDQPTTDLGTGEVIGNPEGVEPQI